MASFFEELVNTRNVTNAAALVGIKRDAAYRHDREDTVLAAFWQGVETVDGSALRHLTKGERDSMGRFLITHTRAGQGQGCIDAGFVVADYPHPRGTGPGCPSAARSRAAKRKATAVSSNCVTPAHLGLWPMRS